MPNNQNYSKVLSINSSRIEEFEITSVVAIALTHTALKDFSGCGSVLLVLSPTSKKPFASSGFRS